MTIGTMYYDFKNVPFSDKLAGALLEYKKKFPDKDFPTHCHVHPDTVIDKNPLGIKIVKDQYIMKNHLWIGVKE